MQRFENCAYKGCSEASEFRSKIELAAQSLNAKVIWDVPGNSLTRFSVSDVGVIHKVHLSAYSPFVDKFYKALGRISSLTWINTRIPGAPLWLYTLYQRDEVKDDFNPCPELWEDPERLTEPERLQLAERWAGNANVVSQLWDVPIERIERYIKQWGLTRTSTAGGGYKFKLSGKAYPEDENEYGQAEQLVDFWRALGIPNNTQASEHTLVADDANLS